MKIEIFFAVRLLQDSRTQSLLITTGVAVGVAVVVFLSALISGLQRDLIDKTVGSQPHIVVEHPEERPRPLRQSEIDEPAIVISQIESIAQRTRSMDGWQRLTHQINDLPGVVTVSAVCRGPAKAVRGAALRNAVITGIDSRTYLEIVDLRRYLKLGEIDVQGRGVVLGAQLAADLGIRPGDVVRLEAGPTDSTSSEVFEVRGIVEVGNRGADETWAFVSLRNAQSLLGLPGGATQLEVSVDSVYRAEAVAGRIREATLFDAESWMETNARLLAGLRSQSASSYVIQAFVLLAVAIGIASVLVVSVVQRRREIGILRAIGLRRRQAQRVFLIQGALLSFFGSILGSLFGAALLKLFMTFVRSDAGQPLFPITLSATLFLFAAATALAVGLLASFFPARSAARLDPVVAIRND